MIPSAELPRKRDILGYLICQISMQFKDSIHCPTISVERSGDQNHMKNRSHKATFTNRRDQLA